MSTKDTSGDGDLTSVKGQMSTKTFSLWFMDATDPKWEEEKPFFSAVPFLQSRADNTNVASLEIRVSLSNIRGFESQMRLDDNGFALARWKHDIPRLDSSIKDTTYPAVKELLASCVGEYQHIIIFDHVIRHSGAKAKAAENSSLGRPSKMAHNDMTYHGTVEQIKSDFGPDAHRVLAGRFRTINVWKPLKGPIRQHHLALCDARTCLNDGHASDLVFPHTVSENMLFSYADHQKWYYVANQADDEVWLLKTMDSASQSDSRIAPFTAHTAAYDTDPALVDEIRESIEFRAYVIG